MKTDSSGHIEIEEFNDYGFTSNPKQNIYTKNLMHGIGLGLICKVNGTRKRGLMHVCSEDELSKNSDKMGLNYNLGQETYKVLDNFIKDFIGNEKDLNVRKNIKAMIVYNRHLFSKEIEGYENPTANCIKEWLKDNDIDLYVSESTTNKKLPEILNGKEDPKEVHHKDFALKNNKIAIVMYNRKGTWLNRDNYELPLI